MFRISIRAIRGGVYALQGFRGVMRFVRTTIALGFVLFGVAVLLISVAAYLTATGRSVEVMKSVVGAVGELTAGQSIEQMEIAVAVDPDERHVDGVTRLIVAAHENRRRVYLLLNDGMEVRSVARLAADGQRHPLSHHRFWVMSVVDLGDDLSAGEKVRLEIAYGGDPLAGLSPFGHSVLGSDEVILTAADLWYPTDLRSFFGADVEVTLPSALRPVHTGGNEMTSELGTSRRTRWMLDRPVQGLSLVAGRYTEQTREDSGVTYAVDMAAGVQLDGARILESMVEASASLGEVYGPVAMARRTLFVSRRLKSAVVDGSGLAGLPTASFAAGDYGFAAIAEAMARSWFGGAIAADPAQPRSGGDWAIEAFAANAARGVVRERRGADAELRWRAARAFDPTVAGILAEASWIDRELAEEAGEDATALRDKGVYVAMMLEDRVGTEAYRAAARHLLDGHRNKTVISREVREAFAAGGAADVNAFFDQWVDSLAQVDLSLDPSQGGAELANHQTAAVAGAVELWRVPPGGQPEEQTLAVGGNTPLGNAERLVVDPRARLADMYRSNNVLPREDAPRRIARSPRGWWLVVEGEPHDWAPARIRVIDDAGRALHSWSFDLGLLGDPRWSADGTHILAAEPSRGGAPKLYALHPSDGSMAEIGHDTIVHGGADGYVAARGDRLVEVVDEDARRLWSGADAVTEPLISPDGSAVAFAAHRGPVMELRLRGLASTLDRVLMTWPRAPMRWQWSPDGAKLFAILAGDWDWQLWEIPLEGEPRALMREAAAVRGLAISEDGRRIALAAAPQIDDQRQRFEVFVIDRDDPTGAQQFTVGGHSAVDLSWRDAESLFVIASDPTYAIVPARRDIKVLALSDGSVTPFP